MYQFKPGQDNEILQSGSEFLAKVGASEIAVK